MVDIEFMAGFDKGLPVVISIGSAFEALLVGLGSEAGLGAIFCRCLFWLSEDAGVENCLE